MRQLAVVLCTALVALSVATSTISAAESGFSDVDPARYDAEAIAWARDGGIVSGYTDACFGPDWTATRAEVIVMLHRFFGSPPTDGAHPFVDVAAAWQQDAVRWAWQNGIAAGVSADHFDPFAQATRGEIAAFMWRAAGSPAAAPGPFVDVMRSWQVEPIGWLAAEGIAAGRTLDRFDPDASVTRGELATFLWRWDGRPSTTVLGSGEPANCHVDTGRCSDVFPSRVVEAWEAAYPDVVFTAAVHDTRTGCRYHLHEGTVVTTASVIKAQVLAGVLLQAQNGERALTDAEDANVELMMHYSHNSPPTSELYVQVGGAAGMEALDAAFGVPGTTHTARYGATLSTADDRTTLVRQLLIGGGPLSDERVAEAWAWMAGVSDAQSWGVSAGLPADHAFALKNGFYPMAGRGWRLGSSGVVRDDDGGAYAVTIMSEHNPTETAGIDLVELIARHINGELTAGPSSPQRSSLVTCIEPAGGTSWTVAAAMLGDVDESTLRLLNGGEAAVLAGQRVCRP
ncbi:MAG: S-layer homology domain-containing protein [Actinomycetota bacterium]